MRLPPPVCRFAGLLFLVAAIVAPLGAVGQAAEARILFIGAQVDAGLDSAPPPSEARLALDRLPAKGGVETALFGARLKAHPVTTFPDAAGAARTAPPTPAEDFHLVVHAGLETGETGPRLTIGGEALTFPEFGDRLEETADAFDARFRRVAYFDFVDPDDAFPAALPALRRAVEPLGFDMLVVTLAPAPAAADCPAAQPLHFAIASGFADRAPFGNGNGVTAIAEAEAYLSAALKRAVARGCGPAYSLILTGRDDDPARALVTRPMTPFAGMEDRLDREIFEAMFLEGSDNLAALTDYLAACRYCPAEAPLAAKRDAMSGRARIIALEEEMWAEIRDDASRERLAVYVDHCTICDHSDTALTRIELLDAAAAAEAEELRAFTAAQTARDLAGLRAYVETCVACAEAATASALIAELEADSAYRAERATLAAALEAANPMQLQAYLDQCETCDGADAARAALDRLAALDAARAPCLALAGLPQAGGPRKLDDIDRVTATEVCNDAAEAFPEDGLLQVLLGRIAQAAGDNVTASAAYVQGMEKGVPAAFGLAAYAAFQPDDGSPIDPGRVEALALEGADRGDWLSQEVLTVLYSKDLVPGKSGREAFETAMKIAEEGDPIAQFFVGHYHLTGVGTEPSEDQAEAWLKKAVEAGYTHADAFLAGIYERRGGDHAGPAAELYWRGLRQGDATARASLTTDLAERSVEVVKIIQGKLREQGLYRGAVDGVPGPGTEAAIRAFAASTNGQG